MNEEEIQSHQPNEKSAQRKKPSGKPDAEGKWHRLKWCSECKRAVPWEWFLTEPFGVEQDDEDYLKSSCIRCRTEEKCRKQENAQRIAETATH